MITTNLTDNKNRLNVRLGVIALFLAILPMAAFADCIPTNGAETLDYYVTTTNDGVTPISLHPEDQPQFCVDQQQLDS